MEPGGEPSTTCGGRTAPLRVRVERMDPDRTDSALWQDAVGPLLRLPRVGKLSRYLTAAYVALHAHDQPTDLPAVHPVGYMTVQARPRRNFVVIRSLWVELDVRRQGVGARLIERLIHDVRFEEIGSQVVAGDPRCEIGRMNIKLLADVPERNVAAQCFFRACGFTGRAGRGRIRFARKL